ncbi:MAG: alanine racemase [Candidatus Omnitrophica bacterium]|nr:alanine racemase [Candidatus Omnitrophota bacterium]
MTRPLWIEVDLRALRNNLGAVKKYLGPKVKIVATIKQSAYGHGLLPIARELGRQGVDCFGLGSVEEAIALREDGFEGSLLVLSAVLDEFVSHFIHYNIIPTVVDLGFARKLDKAAKVAKKIVPIHVKIDTGMGRLGIYYNKAHDFIKKLSNFKNLSLEGIYTHFSVADSDKKFTNQQISVFNNFIKQLAKEKITFKFCHCANSIGIIKYPNAHFNMVRPGLILYGIEAAKGLNLNLKPVLSLKSKIIFIKKITKGRSVSYGRNYIAKGTRNIATVAVGYADGYPWALSNKSRVIIKDDFFNLAGRICMDHIMIDLGRRADIKVGDEVILIGRSKRKKLSIKELAKIANTISYEIVSCLSLKIPRIYRNFLKVK